MSSRRPTSPEDEEPLNFRDPNVTLMEKFRAHYHGRSGPQNLIMSNRFATTYFFIIVTSLIYNFLFKIIPHEFRSESELTRYLLRIAVIWLLIETMVNWLCVRYFETHLVATRDRPFVEGSDWSKPESDITSHPKYCRRCRLVPPPEAKSHHCRDCDKCIIRRDHHCYLVGTCIGYYNQRYFVVLCFYIMIASFFGLYYMQRYLSLFVSTQPDHVWTNYVLPISFWRLITCTYSLSEFTMILQCYTLWWTGPMAMGFFLWQIIIIHQGMTTREFRNDNADRRRTMSRARKEPLIVGNNSTVSENFALIFGPYWLLNFIIPMVLVYKQPHFQQPYSPHSMV